MPGMPPRLLLAVLPLIVLPACGGSADSSAAPPTTVTVTAPAPTTTVTMTAPAPAAPGPATTTPSTTKAPSSTSSATSSATLEYEMPKVVGLNLQDAQDEIQKAVGSFFVSTSHDVSGQGRTQVLDAGWKVCDQNIKAGKAFDDDAKIDLGVVRESEDCP